MYISQSTVSLNLDRSTTTSKYAFERYPIHRPIGRSASTCTWSNTSSRLSTRVLLFAVTPKVRAPTNSRSFPQFTTPAASRQAHGVHVLRVILSPTSSYSSVTLRIFIQLAHTSIYLGKVPACSRTIRADTSWTASMKAPACSGS
jgi:hypothetical protein